MGFRGRKQSRTNSFQDVRLYVLKVHRKFDSHSVFSFLYNCGFVCDVLSEDL